MELNKHGINACIKAHLLSDEQMREIGFTDYRAGYWYFYRDLGNEISFSVTINKNDVEDLKIDILDEDYCQPYDYQYMSSFGLINPIACEVDKKVECWMEYLQNHRVLSGHIKGEYV